MQKYLNFDNLFSVIKDIFFFYLTVSKDRVGAFYSITKQNFSCKVYIVETLHSRQNDVRRYCVSCLTSQEDKRGVR